MKEFFKTIVKWLSFKGRINRIDYLLLHLLPIAILFIINKYVFHFSGVSYFCIWIAAAGVIKRLKDINVRYIGLKVISGLSIWVVIGGIAVIVGFIYLLQGISGLGNKDLVESAALFIAIPILLIILFPLILSFIPGSSNENKYGPVPASFALPKGTLTILVSIVFLLSVVIVVYKTMLPSDPPLVREIKSETRRGSTLSISSILRDGADPNKPSMLGSTPLMLAIENKDGLAVRELLEHGADPNTYSVMESFAQQNDFTRHTPLVVAVSSFSGDNWREIHDDIIMLFLEKGAGITPIQANEDELSPLLEAIKRNQIGMVKMFIEYGVDLNASSNKAALLEAINQQNVRVVSILLTGEINIEQLTTSLEWVSNALKANSDSKLLLKMEQTLQAAINTKTQEEIFPIQDYFIGAPEMIRSLTAYSEQLFRKPMKIRTHSSIAIRTGPGLEYASTGKTYSGEYHNLVAITDVGMSDEFLWFKIKNIETREGEKEGYVSGAYLYSFSDWYIGLN